MTMTNWITCSPGGGVLGSRVAVPLAAMLVASATACGAGAGQVDSITAPVVEPAVVNSALRFGGIVFPPSATVLDVQHDRGIDQRYRLTVRLADPADVDRLLTASNVTEPLPTDSGPVATVHDQRPASPPTVFREITVDRTDPAAPLVRLSLFTT